MTNTCDDLSDVNADRRKPAEAYACFRRVDISSTTQWAARFTRSVFSTIAILGPGLLGASAGIAAHEAQLSKRIVAWARKAEVRLLCEQSPWCDEVCTHAEEAVKDSDLVIICTPVQTILTIYETIAPALKPGAIVTDVGSTKSLIVRLAHGVTPPGTYFIGSHPMAG